MSAAAAWSGPSIKGFQHEFVVWVFAHDLHIDVLAVGSRSKTSATSWNPRISLIDDRPNCKL